MTQDHSYYYKDGSLQGKGQLTDGQMDGYWEWFRKMAPSCAPDTSKSAGVRV